MKWLLVIIFFDISASGDMRHETTVSKVYDTEAECDAVGRDTRAVFPKMPKGVKSMSICIPEIAYRQQGWRER